MSAADQLLAGLELTVTGMATVFVVLTFMVLAIGFMSKLAHRLAPPTEPSAPAKFVGASDSPDPTLIAVLGAAIHRYRNSRR